MRDVVVDLFMQASHMLGGGLGGSRSHAKYLISSCSVYIRSPSEQNVARLIEAVGGCRSIYIYCEAFHHAVIEKLLVRGSLAAGK